MVMGDDDDQRDATQRKAMQKPVRVGKLLLLLLLLLLLRKEDQRKNESCQTRLCETVSDRFSLPSNVLVDSGVSGAVGEKVEGGSTLSALICLEYHEFNSGALTCSNRKKYLEMMR